MSGGGPPPTSIREYEVGAKIGEGFHGVVYRGKWKRTPVAIKKIRLKQAKVRAPRPS